MERGYRDPMTYRRLPLVESMRVTRHVMTLAKLSSEFRNVALHQYVHELMQGKDPMESDWFRRIKDPTQSA